MLQYEGTKLNKDSLIGKGSFTKAYRSNDTVYIVSIDPCKEAIALFTADTKHIPKIERLAYCIDNKNNSVYKMPYYERLKKDIHPTAYKLWLKLEDFIETHNPHKLKGDEWIQLIKKASSLTLACRKALINIIESVMNYTDNFNLEVPKRNVGVDNKGNLILLDVIFDRGLLAKVGRS